MPTPSSSSVVSGGWCHGGDFRRAVQDVCPTGQPALHRWARDGAVARWCGLCGERVNTDERPASALTLSLSLSEAVVVLYTIPYHPAVISGRRAAARPPQTPPA